MAYSNDGITWETSFSRLVLLAWDSSQFIWQICCCWGCFYHNLYYKIPYRYPQMEVPLGEVTFYSI